ncbi:MAG: hypothetical protein AAB483_03690 [Patescibacteria group bacterium]
MTTHHATSPFILALIVLLGGMVGYFLYAQQGDKALVAPAAISDASYLKFKDLKFDFSVFQQPQFQGLKTFGEYPLQSGVTGKQDLFAP